MYIENIEIASCIALQFIRRNVLSKIKPKELEWNPAPNSTSHPQVRDHWVTKLELFVYLYLTSRETMNHDPFTIYIYIYIYLYKTKELMALGKSDAPPLNRCALTKHFVLRWPWWNYGCKPPVKDDLNSLNHIQGPRVKGTPWDRRRTSPRSPRMRNRLMFFSSSPALKISALKISVCWCFPQPSWTIFYNWWKNSQIN